MMWGKSNPATVLMWVEIDSAIWKKLRFLKNSKIEQPYETSIPLMGIYSENPISYHGNIYIAMLSLLHLL